MKRVSSILFATLALTLIPALTRAESHAEGAGQKMAKGAVPLSEKQFWVLGDVHMEVRARVSQDQGRNTLIEEQRLGSVPFLYPPEKDGSGKGDSIPGGASLESVASSTSPAMTEDSDDEVLQAFQGRFVQETVETVTYESTEPGRKPTKMGKGSATYSYFQAEKAAEKTCKIQVQPNPRERKVFLRINGACLPAAVKRVPVFFESSEEGEESFVDLEPGKTATVWVAVPEGYNGYDSIWLENIDEPSLESTAEEVAAMPDIIVSARVRVEFELEE